MPRDLRLRLPDQKHNVAELPRLQHLPVIIVQRALRIVGELEAVHLAAAHVVVHRTPEDEHGVSDDGGRVEEPAGRHEGLGSGQDHRPGLGVQVEAVEIVGERAVGGAAEDVQVTVEGDHGVAVPAGGRRRGAAEDVLGRDAGPAAKGGELKVEICEIVRGGSYTFSLKLNWKREFVIFAPLWPLNTNMLSLATATGKLQQVGGHSPFCSTSSQTWLSSYKKQS